MRPHSPFPGERASFIPSLLSFSPAFFRRVIAFVVAVVVVAIDVVVAVVAVVVDVVNIRPFVPSLFCRLSFLSWSSLAAAGNRRSAKSEIAFRCDAYVALSSSFGGGVFAPLS